MIMYDTADWGGNDFIADMYRDGLLPPRYPVPMVDPLWDTPARCYVWFVITRMWNQEQRDDANLYEWEILLNN